MVGHVRDLGLELLAFGDVLESRHPSPSLQGLIDNNDDSAVARLPDNADGPALADFCPLIGGVFFRIIPERSACRAKCKQLADGGAGLDRVVRKTEHLNVALVAQDETPSRIVHAEALAHVVERRIEPQVALAELIVRAAV